LGTQKTPKMGNPILTKELSWNFLKKPFNNKLKGIKLIGE